MSFTNHTDAATTSLKNTSIVFREENDISEQVDKPIYPEGLDNDSPLTFNKRASESCGAIQAGHTVTAVEDIPQLPQTPLHHPLLRYKTQPPYQLYTNP